MLPDVYLDCRSELGESPIWDGRRHTLWWVDIHRGLVCSHEQLTGQIRLRAMPSAVGSLALKATAGVVIALQRQFAEYSDSDERLRTLAELAQPDNVRLNDGRCDRQGRFVCGGMDNSRQGIASASLYRLGKDGRAENLLDGVVCTNSVCFSPDGKVMYFADMPTGVIVAFDYTAEGPLARSNAITLADESSAPGLPDGSAVDAEGCIWNARFGAGQIVRYTPSGKVDRVISLPVSKVTCVAFGGSRLDTMFVTTANYNLSPDEKAAQPHAGSIFALNPGVKGLPEDRFGGGA